MITGALLTNVNKLKLNKKYLARVKNTY